MEKTKSESDNRTNFHGAVVITSFQPFFLFFSILEIFLSRILKIQYGFRKFYNIFECFLINGRVRLLLLCFFCSYCSYCSYYSSYFYCYSYSLSSLFFPTNDKRNNRKKFFFIIVDQWKTLKKFSFFLFFSHVSIE